MATQEEINRIRGIIVAVELDALVAGANFNQIKSAVSAAGSTVQNAITIGVNNSDSKKVGEAIIAAVEDFGRPSAESIADGILADEQLTIDEIFKYKKGL